VGEVGVVALLELLAVLLGHDVFEKPRGLLGRQDAPALERSHVAVDADPRRLPRGEMKVAPAGIDHLSQVRIETPPARSRWLRGWGLDRCRRRRRHGVRGGCGRCRAALGNYPGREGRIAAVGLALEDRAVRQTVDKADRLARQQAADVLPVGELGEQGHDLRPLQGGLRNRPVAVREAEHGPVTVGKAELAGPAIRQRAEHVVELRQITLLRHNGLCFVRVRVEI
jgi:hypothetical protein